MELLVWKRWSCSSSWSNPIAQGLADSYVFIDINEKKAEADAQDFKDAMANLPSYANIVVNDYAALEDADVIISSLGNIQLQHNAGEDRFAEFHLLEKPFIRFLRNLKNWILKAYFWLSRIL